MTWTEWACVFFGMLLMSFAIIGFFDWLGLIQFTELPCPCRDAAP